MQRFLLVVSVALFMAPVQSNAMTFDCRFNTSAAFVFRDDWQRQPPTSDDYVDTYSDINIRTNSAKITSNAGTDNAIVMQVQEGIIFIQTRQIGEIITKIFISRNNNGIPAVQFRPHSLDGAIGTQTIHGRCQIRR